jgi:tetratricopeptide (TPR) repeat protein
LIAARTFQNSNENYPYSLFQIFENSLNTTGIEQPLPALKSQFYKKLAERHYELWEKSDTVLTHPKACLELYKKVLTQDPTDCEALHNTAILYFNIGVNKIKTISVQSDIESLINIQEEALELFRQALPFAQSTFNECPKTTSQFKALMYIQKSLGNDEEFERLQMEYKKQFPNE